MTLRLIGLFLSLQFLDQTFGRLHVGMLVGILQTQLIHLLFQRLDAIIDFAVARPRYGRRGNFGLLVRQLALQLIAAVERFLLVQLRLLQLRTHVSQFCVIVAALPRHHADVLLLELLECVVGVVQSLLILLQLLLDEARELEIS